MTIFFVNFISGPPAPVHLLHLPSYGTAHLHLDSRRERVEPRETSSWQRRSAYYSPSRRCFRPCSTAARCTDRVRTRRTVCYKRRSATVGRDRRVTFVMRLPRRGRFAARLRYAIPDRRSASTCLAA